MNDPTETWCRTALSGQALDRPLNPPDGYELDEDELDAYCEEEAEKIVCDSSLLKGCINDEEFAYPVADICDLLDGAMREWADVSGLHPELSNLLRACHNLKKTTLAMVNDETLRDRCAGDLIQDMKEAA